MATAIGETEPVTVEEQHSDQSSSANGKKRRPKLPRGYVGIRRRLNSALKNGATLNELLGTSQAKAGARLRDGIGVRKASLRNVDKALTRWEKKIATRRPAEARVAEVITPAGVTAEQALSIIESFSRLDAVMQQRVLLMLAATKKEAATPRI